MTKIRKFLAAVCLILAAGCAAVCVFGGEETINSCVKNDDCYLTDIENMSGEDFHSLNLQKGDALKIYYKTVKGNMKAEIKSAGGTVIYSGDGTGPGEFTVNISESGVYTVTLTAFRARGELHIEVCKQQGEQT